MIGVAVAEWDGSVRELGIIANRPEAVRKLIAELGPLERVRVCYEAGPTGYPLYWQLTALGVYCEVIAPSLVPTKAGVCNVGSACFWPLIAIAPLGR